MGDTELERRTGALAEVGGTPLTRLGTTSLVTTGAEYVAYLALVDFLDLHYAASSLLVTSVGTLLSFMLARHWVFRGAAGSGRRQLVLHVAITSIGIGGGAALLMLLVELLWIQYWLAWILQCLVVFFSWTYPASRHITFPDPTQRPQRVER